MIIALHKLCILLPRYLSCSNCLEMFRTGSGLLQQVDEVTEDGFKKIFTTNLFGHFILVHHSI